MSEIELAWAAGFFDGEGCTNVHHCINRQGKHYYYFALQVPQNDPRPLQRFIDAVGEGRIVGPYPSRPTQHRMQIYNDKAERVITKLWPYLSEPKKEQAIRVREEIDAILRSNEAA